MSCTPARVRQQCGRQREGPTAAAPPARGPMSQWTQPRLCSQCRPDHAACQRAGAHARDTTRPVVGKKGRGRGGSMPVAWARARWDPCTLLPTSQAETHSAKVNGAGPADRGCLAHPGAPVPQKSARHCHEKRWSVRPGAVVQLRCCRPHLSAAEFVQHIALLTRLALFLLWWLDDGASAMRRERERNKVALAGAGKRASLSHAWTSLRTCVACCSCSSICLHWLQTVAELSWIDVACGK